MQSSKILKLTSVHFRKKSFAFAATFALFLSIFSASPSQALEQRVIDVVSITWNRAGALPGTITTMKSQIDSVVGPLWKQLTTVYGDPNDKRIEFVSGQTLADPIKLNFAIP